MILSDEQAYVAGQRLAILGMGASAFLAVLKLLGGTLAGSTALLADGFESALDVIASGVVFGGMAIARKPPDDKFPYGYGRAESLAGKTVSTILLVSGALLITHCVHKLRVPAHALPFWALAPLALSFLVKAYLSITKWKLGTRLGSSSLQADAANDSVDMISAVVASTAIGLNLANPALFNRADAVGGLLVAVIILFLGVRMFRQTSTELMDVMPDPQYVETVRSVAESVGGIRQVEKCFGRKSGLSYFFDLHVHVDSQMPVLEAHRLSHEVKDMILQECPYVRDVLVHVEPAVEEQAAGERAG
jgi:cation diffusion facilitator family transporter